MKLSEIRRFKPLHEEDIAVQAAADLWKTAQDADKTKTYISSTVYMVRKIDGMDQYEVDTENGDQRQLVGKMSKVKLDAQFVPIRPNQQPDIEGFTQYRDVSEVQAFQNEDGTTVVDLGTGTTSKLLTGDYLVQKSDDNKFSYEVVKSTNFESLYTEK